MRPAPGQGHDDARRLVKAEGIPHLLDEELGRAKLVLLSARRRLGRTAKTALLMLSAMMGGTKSLSHASGGSCVMRLRSVLPSAESEGYSPFIGHHPKHRQRQLGHLSSA